MLSGCLAESDDQFKAYRESIRHLLLPIHRLEESKVADYSSWVQAKNCCVVIKGNL